MTASEIQIFIRKPHGDPLPVAIAPTASVGELKRLCGCVGANLRWNGSPLRNADTLMVKGIVAGSTLHAFPPTSGDAKYQAARRLITGITQRSTAHQDLHFQTQAVVMDEGQRTRMTIEERCDGLEAKVDRLLTYQEEGPPANPGGSGSSTDLRAEAAALNVRANALAREERKAQKQAEKVAVKRLKTDASSPPPAKRISSTACAGRCEGYSRLTVPALRALLAEKGLDTRGKKDELIGRFVANSQERPAESAPGEATPLPVAPEVQAWPSATPLAAQNPVVARLLQGAEDIVQQGRLTALARDRYFAAMRQHYEPYRPSVACIETLSMAQLRSLCVQMQIPVPQSFHKLGETRAAIGKRCVGPDEYRVAQFLAEQTADAMNCLSEQRSLLDAGALVLHTAKFVAELAMVLGPVVFHDDGVEGETKRITAYRVVSLDDMRVGYAKNINEVLLWPPAQPSVPAHVELWRPPDAADFLEDSRRSGRCFLRTERLIAIAGCVGVSLPKGAKYDSITQALCSWAAETCLEYVRSQLRGRVLYALVPVGAVRTSRFTVPSQWWPKCDNIILPVE